MDVTEAVCYLHQQMGIMHSDICARWVVWSGQACMLCVLGTAAANAPSAWIEFFSA